MMVNYIRIKFFFFLLSFFPFEINALDVPDAKPRPYIKQTPFSDVFQQIKKQNWVMAIKLADDHNDQALSSYIRWLDITRPGSLGWEEYPVGGAFNGNSQLDISDYAGDDIRVRFTGRVDDNDDGGMEMDSTLMIFIFGV